MREVLERLRSGFAQPGFAGLLGASVAFGMASSFVSPFLSIWGTQEVGMKPVMFGFYMTATSLCAIVVSTSLARWSDTHLPRKAVMLAASGAAALGYAGYAVVRQPWALLAIGCTLIALGGMCFSQLFAHTRERFTAGGAARGLEPGFLMSMVRVCFAVAWTGGPALGAWMLTRHGFEGLFLGGAGLYLVFLLGVWRFVPWEARGEHVRTAPRLPVWRELTRGDVAAVFAAFLLVFAAHAMNTMNLPLTITKVLGGSGGDVGITFCVGPVVEIPLMLWFGHLASRGWTLPLIRIGGAVTVAYFLVLTQAQAPWHVWCAQILSGVSFAILTNVAILFFQDLLPGQPGLATTIFANAGNVGNLTGYFCFGALVEAVGHRGVFFVSAILTTAMLAIVLVYRPRHDAAPLRP